MKEYYLYTLLSICSIWPQAHCKKGISPCMQTQYVSQSESVVTQSFSELHWPTTQGDTIFSGPRILDTNWHTHTQTVRVSLKSFDWNTCRLFGWNGMDYGVDCGIFVSSRWHLCSSCFHPFPLCQTSEDS